MSNYQTICETSDVPEGEARMFMIQDLQIGVFHVGEEFFALDNRCPHAAASLAHGILEDETICCRIHHWKFNLRDGQRLDESCSKSKLRCFPVRVVGKDLQIDLGDSMQSSVSD